MQRTLSKFNLVMGKKVTVLGAAGGIGQPLSLLLKERPKISSLSLYDVAPVVKGIAADLSHLPSAAKVQGFHGDDALPTALCGADIVLMVAGVPRKPSMTRDDLFKINAGINFNLAKAIAANCPSAVVLVVANPVNSIVPLVAEVLKNESSNGKFDARKLLGVTTLDILRGNTFVSEAIGKSDIEIDVLGGHSGCTIVPILSPFAAELGSSIPTITKRIQYGGDEIVAAKQGAGSATLSMAAAAARLTDKVLQGMSTSDASSHVSECAYVSNSEFDSRVSYFASRVKLGPHGVSATIPIDKSALSDSEIANLEVCVEELSKNIQKGIEFAKSKYN